MGLLFVGVEDRVGFIEKAKLKHGVEYDYSKVEYINNHTDVIIICSVHGEFKQRPNNHLNGSGCKECAKLKRAQTNLDRYGHINVAQGKEIKQKIRATNLERYGVEDVLHSDIMRDKANQSRLDRYGHINPAFGADARGKIRNTNFERYGVYNVLESKEIQEKRKNTMLSRYGVEYSGQSVELREKQKQTILDKYNGIHYAQDHMRDILDLIEDYDWLYEEYIVKDKTAQQIADELGITNKTLCKYLRKKGFDIKYTVGYSYRCIKWLNSIMEREGINIQHMLNGGEYRIPNTKYRVDGFCVETNTIYEFYGDCWHGNPKMFKDYEFCNHWSNLTAGELYKNTMIREQQLITLGYNIISIWEDDWLKG